MIELIRMLAVLNLIIQSTSTVKVSAGTIQYGARRYLFQLAKHEFRTEIPSLIQHSNPHFAFNRRCNALLCFVPSQNQQKEDIAASAIKNKHLLYACNEKKPSTYTDASFHTTTNQQLVEKRNEILRRKREARQRLIEKDRDRNLRLRQLFIDEDQFQHHDIDLRSKTSHFDSSSQRNVMYPPMFAIKVVTCRALRSELNLSGREKRGRMFVERPPFFSSIYNHSVIGASPSFTLVPDIDDDVKIDDYACMSLKALRLNIHEFFRRLKKSTYILSASLPVLDENGNVLMFDEDEIDAIKLAESKPLLTDEDVQNSFVEAENFFLQNQKNQNKIDAFNMKRPTLVLHVTKDPNAPPPKPLPCYLRNLPDPNASPTMTMLSFYSFPPNGGLSDPEQIAEQLKRLWRPFRALGRVYVAKEGINAQMAIPTNVLNNFFQCCTLQTNQGGELSNVLGAYMENGMNIDPIEVPMEEYHQNPAFRNMHIRVRNQIVTDGLDRPLDWQKSGYDMPPLEWHQKLKEAREIFSRPDKVDPLPVVLDCRNYYETQVGKFELAEPLQTENFRDSWDALKERLKDVPKDAPIMTYCTGGIRCVKVNAYLTQELDFTNVSRLAGGIVGYDRTLKEQSPSEESLFKGVNYVFDGRMGRRITDDQLGKCFTCGNKTHLISNCSNGNCHKRMVQCQDCRSSYIGTCSEGCKARVIASGLALKRPDVNDFRLNSTINKDKLENNLGKELKSCYIDLDDYSSSHSSPSPPLLKEIELNTAALTSGSHMVSGHIQGQFLSTLASLSQEGRILEIGTFTGYATACLLHGASIAGTLSRRGTNIEGSCLNGGPYVLSLERDKRALGVAAAHLKVMTELGMGDDAAIQAAKLRVNGAQDFEDDSITFKYNNIATCKLLRVNDALATIEEMASGCHPVQTAPFDLVFVDADKTRLIEYVDCLARNNNVLKKGGLIVVDNVLWKGLVLDASCSENEEIVSQSISSTKELQALRKNRRARKLANKMHRFNSAVIQDKRVEVLMMPIRDGLSLIRKRF